MRPSPAPRVRRAAQAFSVLRRLRAGKALVIICHSAMASNEPVRQHPISRVTSWVSLLLIGISAIVLTGWATGSPALTSLGGAISMKPNAAIGLLACALSLRGLGSRRRGAATAGRMLAFLAGALGILTLSQHIIGWNLDIDELLFSEAPGAVATASPARMGPNSSTSLTLAALALLCLYRASRRSIVTAQLLAACMAVIALVPVVGYMYGATELYAIARYTGIALHTGLSFLALSVGILGARPTVGPVAALTSDAAHGVMARRLLVPAIAAPLLLGYVRVAGERRGFYDAGLGAAMFVVIVIVLFSLTIWRTAVAVARVDVARRSAEEALTETEQRFRSLADQAPVLIWVEEAGARVWFNRRWFEFTGASPGTDWRALVHPDDLPGCEAVWRDAARTNTSYSHQYRLRRADGDFAWVLETASPRALGRGSAGYVGSCIDVTELRRAQQDRDDLLMLERSARQKAERADRAKDDFIAMLSHELRTPLNAVLGWTHMLQQGSVPDPIRAKATDAVARNAAALGRLIEDLLDTSRMTTGHVELTRELVDMKLVVQAAVESVMPTAAARRIDLALSAPPAAPGVSGDAQRLQQIVWNLLSNAIKFSPEGSRVQVELSAIDRTVLVSVRDEGGGIEPEFLPHVFDRFRQADFSLTRVQGGLGLGLYIAQYLAQLHGGRIRAHSDGAGRGATFTMELPVAADVSGDVLAGRSQA